MTLTNTGDTDITLLFLVKMGDRNAFAFRAVHTALSEAEQEAIANIDEYTATNTEREKRRRDGKMTADEIVADKRRKSGLPHINNFKTTEHAKGRPSSKRIPSALEKPKRRRRR